MTRDALADKINWRQRQKQEQRQRQRQGAVVSHIDGVANVAGDPVQLTAGHFLGHHFRPQAALDLIMLIRQSLHSILSLSARNVASDSDIHRH